MDDGTSHPSLLSCSAGNMTISGIGQRNVLSSAMIRWNIKAYGLGVSPESRSTQPPSIFLIDAGTRSQQLVSDMEYQVIDKVRIAFVISQFLSGIGDSGQECPTERLGPFDHQSVRIMFGSQSKG